MTSISTKATVHGAISIVNAIATGKGSALGISLETTAEIHLRKGEGRIVLITGIANCLNILFITAYLKKYFNLMIFF